MVQTKRESHKRSTEAAVKLEKEVASAEAAEARARDLDDRLARLQQETQHQVSYLPRLDLK